MMREHTVLHALARLRATSLSDCTIVVRPNALLDGEDISDWEEEYAHGNIDPCKDDSVGVLETHQIHCPTLRLELSLYRRPQITELIQYVSNIMQYSTLFSLVKSFEKFAQQGSHVNC